MRKYNLLCMGFDGDFQIEDNRGESFDSIEDAWERDNDMGSRWHFYPFRFVVTESNLTIADSPDPSWLYGWATRRRVKTIAAIFNAVSEMPENKNMDSEAFAFALLDYDTLSTQSEI